MTKEKIKIDLVYLWVDGNDKEFIKSKKYWEEKLNIPVCESNNDHKYVDHEELRYSLRSVMKNAPWINRIFIVTNGQIPKWLDLDKSSSKIKLINHKDIMPEDSLPTFNSNAIEACIANIADLSEHFILANDDCFINRPVKPNFFFDKNGKPIVRLINQYANRKLLKKYLYHRNIRRSTNLIYKKYHKRYCYIPQHNMDAYTKTYYKECINEFSEEFNILIHQKFREKSIQRIIIAFYMLAKKNCKLVKIKKSQDGQKDSLYMRISSGSKMQDTINIINPYLLCLNDFLGVEREYITKYKSFLEFLYPEKSIYENNEKIEEIYDNIISNLVARQKKYTFKWHVKNTLSKILKPIFFKKQENGYKIYLFLGFIKISIANITNVKKINQNYQKVILRLHKKLLDNKKIKVIFMVTENSKWAYQSVYDEFAKSKEFEPLVLVSVLNKVQNGQDKTRESIESNYNFYKSRGLNVQYMYQNGQYIPLKNFNPDIVFYEQPWGLNKEYTPKIVSKYALCCYVPYSYMVIKYLQAYNQTFHKHLYKFFIENKLLISDYEKYKKKNSKNCVVTGYPKLDVYTENKSIDIENLWKEPNKFKIIYAPHHSVDNLLQCATFKENGKFILEWAKKHPETTFIFKPHPRLKFALQNCHFMNEKEIENYYHEWENIGKVYLQGDYFDIFKTSDLMLTDSVSFLAEYLPSKKPLIRMVNENNIGLNKLGENIVSEYYHSHNNNELEQILNDIAINKNDYNKENRLKLIDKMFDFKEKSSTKIYKYLLTQISENLE